MNEPSHVKVARALVGRPFLHRGRGPEFFDCVGVVRVSFAAVGIELEDRRVYGRNARADGLRPELYRQFGPPVPGQPIPGDVGAFRYKGEWHHVGIFGWHPVENKLSLIHAHGSVQKVAEHAFEGSSWARCWVGLFRHPATRGA